MSPETDRASEPTHQHVTAGRVPPRNTEYTLCGIAATWTYRSEHKDLPLCAACERLDA